MDDLPFNVEMTEADNQQENSTPKKGAHLQAYQFKKGQSGNPAGRPKGRTLKEYAQNMLASMTEEEIQDYLQGIDKKTIWEMAEGKAKQDLDIDATVMKKVISVDE